ncbi:hypothetical protein Y032_0010g965 [Ancylostoma ceylanicum]|uniref:Uncharacterized protein n=1 Tax=Ancylostoma ceylanicum TaxID=53326 RepID=A0A016VID1_9BILA|nr:hypothetical protein Y032_0010g965 [Ancylostoma ceylanicum]
MGPPWPSSVERQNTAPHWPSSGGNDGKRVDEGVRKAPEHESTHGGWAQHAPTVRKGLQTSWSNSEKRVVLWGKGHAVSPSLGHGWNYYHMTVFGEVLALRSQPVVF